MINLHDLRLHKNVTKHSNIMIPYSYKVCYNDFPEQITELLNTEITLKYDNYYESLYGIFNTKAEITIDGKKISSRPSDDVDFIYNDNPDMEKIHDEFIKRKTEPFIVLRADKVSPFVLIAISKDYSKVLVCHTNTHYNSITHVWPIQFNEFISLVGSDKYTPSNESYDSYTIRVDNTEPCYSVLMEVLEKYDDGTKLVRFVLEEECTTKIKGYVDPDLTYHEIDDWSKYNHTLSNDDITRYRKNLLDNIIIYGTQNKEKEN